ncbi:hypothetical protein [Rhodovulum euryhalinum]|uniref:Cytochrome c domain-containing protein n=1 Tax=Rhodovulum euryhalinum TaxID=35805 RepID=A0A4R2K7Q8_9RHOB|nr:hypothetical protein [Rhodovulum euryhalinum]TCO69393.1 hypothetical protein EV655_11522 [Rhodovulum euryhalinum]
MTTLKDFHRTMIGLLFCAGAALAQVAHADPGDDDDDHEEHEEQMLTLAQKLAIDLSDGTGTFDADTSVVEDLIIGRGLSIPYSYVNMLMHTPNAFGPGPACVVCHSSADPAKSYRGLDLSSCDGIRTGSTEAPARPIITPGNNPAKGILGRRLRNNRMPFGTNFQVPTRSPNIELVEAWIRDGAVDDQYFNDNVLPLFATEGAFGSDAPACTDCHMSNHEPPSFHEMDLTSFRGIMLGADSVAKGVENATKIVIPGAPEASPLLQHLTENRMPPGISPVEDRDHPNTLILFEWVRQGAPCE